MASQTSLENYSIRKAEEKDLEAIRDLYNDQIKNGTALFIFDPVDLANRQNWLKDCQERGYPIIVAVDKITNQTIGYASCGEFRSKLAFIVSTEISLYIHANHHRKGLGKVLLDEMLRIADDMHLRSVLALITADNEASKKLFLSRQFSLAGTLHNVGYKFGRYLDLVFYERVSADEYCLGKERPSFKPFPWNDYEFDPNH